MASVDSIASINTKKRIKKLAKKYKNKKIVIYGAGSFSQEIFQNYDLSELNIIAIADLKFNDESQKHFYSLNCIIPEELAILDYDVILIANEDYPYFYQIIKNLVENTKNKNIIIDSLIDFKYKNSIEKKVFGFFYYLFKPENFLRILIKYTAKFCTFWIFNKDKKNKKYISIYHHITTGIFGYQVLNTAKSIGKNFWCGGFSEVTRNTRLKNNVCFNGMRIMGGGKVTIGRYFHSGVDCMILTQNHNYDSGDAIPYDHTFVYKETEIGDFVLMGSRVIVLPGTKIGEGVVIQGGSVVHGEIPPYAIIGGNPAKVFKYRDIEHFKRLKSECKFR